MLTMWYILISEILLRAYGDELSKNVDAECCARGVHQAAGSKQTRKTESSCYKNYDSVFQSDGAVCGSLQKLCCLKSEIKQSCLRGEAYGKPIHASPCHTSVESDGVHASTFLSCCECCTLGKLAALNNVTTCASTFIYNKKCDGIYTRCCLSIMADLKRPQKCEEANCEHECKMSIHGPQCFCQDGFRLGIDNITCIDIDECLTESVNCNDGFICANTLGSYHCHKNITKLDCEPGYIQYDTICRDMDECATGIDACPENSNCENTLGSYHCTVKLEHECQTGFFESMGQCVDKNECKMHPKPCQRREKCINLVGSYRCQAFSGLKCPKGYIFTDGSCVDINECAALENPCSSNGELCVNIPGNYRCVCLPGFKRNPLNLACIDINECTIPGRRICDQICNNKIGGFQCSCYDGYRLRENNRTCEDLDECENLDICNEEFEVCENARGGYVCLQKDCPSNYRRVRTGLCLRACPFGQNCDDKARFISTTVLSRSRQRPFRISYLVNVRQLHQVERVNFELLAGNEDGLFKLEKRGFSRVWITSTKPSFSDRDPFNRLLVIKGEAVQAHGRHTKFEYHAHVFFY